MLVKIGTAFIGGHFTRADVRVENGKIAQIGDLQPREGEEIRSAAGLYVLPGLVDIHIHAYAGADCMRGEDDVRRMSEGLLKTGVAAFMPTTMSAPIEATNRALRAIQAVRDMPCEKGAAVLPLLTEVKTAMLQQEAQLADWFAQVLEDTTHMARLYPNYLKGTGIDVSAFSDTALEVLRLQAAGYTTREIAQQLHITQRTVKYHASENYRKLDARNLVDAVQIAQSLHIL